MKHDSGAHDLLLNHNVFIVWEDKYNVGIPIIDEQHRGIVTTINSLHFGIQHDYYTDIITFDYTEKNKIGGDIFISLDTVRSNAEKYGEPFEREFRRVVIHGILHLCGQKDKSPADRAEMTRKENEALQLWEQKKSEFQD